MILAWASPFKDLADISDAILKIIMLYDADVGKHLTSLSTPETTMNRG